MDILVTRSSMPPLDEYVDEIRELWESHWLTNMGTKHKALQRALEDYLGSERIELFTNGHMALELSLQALKLKGEVITTPFTFASTTHAIVRNGLTPVFCDIRPDDYTLDAEKIEPFINENTCAIMPVHVYGNVCQVEEIEGLAKKYKLKVIYDAAHAFGVKYKGQGAAGFGDVSCFSFHATKVFHTIEGGAACFRSGELGQRLEDLKNFGIHGPESVMAVGANAKMNEFCAAMGLCNLRHLGEQIEKRRLIVGRYRERLDNIAGLKLNTIQENVEPNFAYFPVVVEPESFGVNRDVVMSALADAGIYARKYFYPLTCDFDCYQGAGYRSDVPVARYTSDRVITLPLYEDLPIPEVDRICDRILSLKR